MKPIILLPGALGVLFSGLGHAQTTLHWRTEAGNGNWNDINNWWNGNATELPPGAEILSFANNIQPSMTNDLASTTRHGIVFESGASTVRTIGGSAENAFVAVGGNAPFIRNNSAAAHILNFPISIGSAGLILDTVNGALNLNGTISGSGLITKSGGVAGGGGAQNAVITGNNENFTGKWLVTGGNLSINSDAALGAVPESFVADAITLDGGSLANMSNANGTGFSAGHSLSLHANRGITLGTGGGNIRIGYGQTVTINGAISGSGGLSRTDGGTLVLASGSNSYAGITHLRAGTTRTDANGALPATTNVLLYGGSTLHLNGTSQTIAGLHVGGTGDANTTLQFGDGGSLTVTGNAMPGGSPTNAGADLYTRITGTGTLTYAHATTHNALWNLHNTNNDFTGDIVITRGRLRTALGTDNAGVFGNADNDIVFNGDVVDTLGNGEGTASIQGVASGALNLGAGRSIILNDGKEGTFYVWGGNTYTVEGVVTGGGNLRKEDGGILLLNNTSNDYTGLTRIASGTLRAGAAGVIPDASSVEIAGGTFHLNNHNETVASLFGTGGEVTGGSTLTVLTSGEADYAGRIRNGVTVHMAGAGTQILSGTGDNDSGYASVESGTLVLAKTSSGSIHAIGRTDAVGLTINGGTARLDGTGDDQIYFQTHVEQNGGTFDFNGRNEGFRALIGTGGTVTNSAAATASTLILGEGSLSENTYTYGGAITDGTGTMALVKTGDGTQILGGASTYTGDTDIQGGTLALGAGGSIANSSTIIVGATSTLDVSATGGWTLGSSQTLVGGGTITGAVASAGTGSTFAPGASPGTLTFNGDLNLSAGGTFEMELGLTSDLIAVAGILTGSDAPGELIFDFSDAGGLLPSTAYTLFTFSDHTGLDYTDLAANTLPGGLLLDPGFGTGGWLIGDNTLQVQFIPEPSAALLAALGSLAFAARRRR